MKKFILGITLSLLGIALIVVLARNVDAKDFFGTLLQFPLWGFLVLLLLTIFTFFLASWRGALLLRAQGIYLSFWRIMEVMLVGYAFNYTTPFVYVGGEGIKAYLLVDQFKLPWGKAAGFLILDRIFEIASAFLVIIAAIILFVAYTGLSGLTKTILSVIVPVSITSVIGVFIYIQFVRKQKVVTPLLRIFSLHKSRLGKILEHSEDEILQYFHMGGRVLWPAWGISILKQIVLTFRHLLLIYLLGKGVHILLSFISLGALFLTYTFPVPGSLGVQEIFQSAIFALFGLGAGEGLALSFILRGIDVFFVIIGTILLFHHGSRLIVSSALNMLRFNNGNGSAATLPEAGSMKQEQEFE